ncbi:hypothetical protein YC2023_024651 [Brassica napus]
MKQPGNYMITRARAGIVKPNPRHALFPVKSDYTQPKSLKAALRDPRWNGSMETEICTMHETETWDLVSPHEESIGPETETIIRSTVKNDVKPSSSSSSFSVTALNAQRSYKASATSMTRPAHYPATRVRLAQGNCVFYIDLRTFWEKEVMV